MADERRSIDLSTDDLRAVAAFAAACAEDVLAVFERLEPTDARPRRAVDEAWAFARGGPRRKGLRDAAWAALRAAGSAKEPAAAEAARAAMAAASAPFLHPLADATQVRHILGAPAHAARAVELAAGDEGEVAAAEAAAQLLRARGRATDALVEVLARYPDAPAGGGRVGALMRELDRALRGRG